MSEIKAVASGYFMMSYFNINWTPMRSIFLCQALQIYCKPTFGALDQAWKFQPFKTKIVDFFP